MKGVHGKCNFPGTLPFRSTPASRRMCYKSLRYSHAYSGSRLDRRKSRAEQRRCLCRGFSPEPLLVVPPIELVDCLYAPYVRGQAYLSAGQGKEAAAEFQ